MGRVSMLFWRPVSLQQEVAERLRHQFLHCEAPEEHTRTIFCRSLDSDRISSSPQPLGLSICSSYWEDTEKDWRQGSCRWNWAWNSSPHKHYKIICFQLKGWYFSPESLHGRTLPPPILRVLTFLILLIPFQIISWWSGILLRLIDLCLHNEFMHVLLNPHCVYLKSVHSMFFGSGCFTILSHLATGTAEHPNLKENCNKMLQELAVISPCALHSAWSALNPTRHSWWLLPSVNEARLQTAMSLKTH